MTCPSNHGKMATAAHVIIVEPFSCGSHKQLTNYLQALVAESAPSARVTLCELPGSKWHWRARAGSLWAVSAIPKVPSSEVARTTLFCSSMLNLCELLGLRPDLLAVKRKILYFHENQLVFPIRRKKQEDQGQGNQGGSKKNNNDPKAAAAAPSTGSSLAVTTIVAESSSSSAETSAAETEGAAMLAASSTDSKQQAQPPAKRARTEEGDGAASFSPSTAAVAAASSADNGDRDRDFHFGWLQVLSCLAADTVAFNSHFNLQSFVESIPALTKMIPDKAQRPNAEELQTTIRAKSLVAHFPVVAPPPPLAPPPLAPLSTPAAAAAAEVPPLVIVWPHRWEYDKQPDVFFKVLKDILPHDFRLVLLGESFSEVPKEFAEAHAWLSEAGKILHWGFAPSKDDYFKLLRASDVVVSTAAHEFFGVSTVEAVMAGCYPLCPGGLAYPELLCPNAEELAAATAPTTAVGTNEASASASAAGLVVEGGSSSGAAPAAPGAGAAAALASKPKQHRQAPPGYLLTRMDDTRGGQCPHLYTSPADLRRKLVALATAPDKVRAWKKDWLGTTMAVTTTTMQTTIGEGGSAGGAAGSAGTAGAAGSTFRFDRFDASSPFLRNRYLALLGLPTVEMTTAVAVKNDESR